MTQIEVSLARAHKIAERLKDRATQLFQEATSLASSVRIMALTGEGQVQRLSTQGARALELSGKAERYTLAAAAVRAVIARENQSRGINELLGKMDGLNRVLNHKKELLTHAKAEGLQVGELANYKAISDDVRYGLSVNVFDDAARQAIEAQVAQLQREIYMLSDRIAEANAQRVALTMDEDLAQEVTG